MDVADVDVGRALRHALVQDLKGFVNPAAQSEVIRAI